MDLVLMREKSNLSQFLSENPIVLLKSQRVPTRSCFYCWNYSGSVFRQLFIVLAQWTWIRFISMLPLPKWVDLRLQYSTVGMLSVSYTITWPRNVHVRDFCPRRSSWLWVSACYSRYTLSDRLREIWLWPGTYAKQYSCIQNNNEN